jgi:chaperonin GroES
MMKRKPCGAGCTSRIPLTERPTQGAVLAVGPGRIEKGQRVKMDVQAGDKVIYGKYSGTPYQVGEDELIIIKASDILAKIG